MARVIGTPDKGRFGDGAAFSFDAGPKIDLDYAEGGAVARLIREHLRTTRNPLALSLAPLKSAYAKLAPGDEPPPTSHL